MTSDVATPDEGASHTVTVGPDDAGKRLDRFLYVALGAPSRSRMKALIRQGQVSGAAGTIEEPDYRVKPGEVYIVRVPAPVPAVPRAEDIPLDVAYEDDQLIVINKPAGLVVHPAAGNWTGTLVNALIAHCGESLSGIGGVRRPGIVHRLDKDTSGLIVVAKTDAAHRALTEQFAAHGRDGRLERAYLAVVWGVPERKRGTIDAPIARSQGNRTKMAVARSGGRDAVTHYDVLEIFADEGGRPVASLLRCRLETGRTHQIRVHMASIGHPLLGDGTYGAGHKASARNLSQAAQSALKALKRQALHASSLGFDDPASRVPRRFESNPPDDMQALLEALRQTGER